MAQQHINYSSPNDNLGDKLRDFAIKQESNNTELYTNKVDKITGQGLSDTNFTQAEKDKLAGLSEDGQVQSDWDQGDNLEVDFIKNKPTNTSNFTNDGDGTLPYVPDVPAVGSFVRSNGEWVDINFDSLISTSVTSYTFAINSGNNTKFDFSVIGVIRDPSTGGITNINYSQTAITVTTNIYGVTYFGVKSDGTLTQQDFRFTSEQRYNHLCEWAVVYNIGTGVIITHNPFPNTSNQIGQQFANAMSNRGVINYGNNQYLPFGATSPLNIYKPIGGMVEGVGWGNLDSDNPNEKIMAAINSAATFQVRKSTGLHLDAQTAIDPTIYESTAGNVTTIPNATDVTVKEICFFNSNLTRTQLGQVIHSNIDDAVSFTLSQSESARLPFGQEKNISDNGIVVTYLAIQKNCTSWAQTDRYRFFANPNTSRNASSPFATFNSIYQAVTTPQLNITDGKGSFDVKSDRASNTSKIWRFLNNLGVETAWISGDGNSSFNALTTILSGLTATSGTFTSANTILEAFGKVKYLIDNIAATYQAILVSGTNIKTINGSSILGSGNLNTGVFKIVFSGDSATLTGTTSVTKMVSDIVIPANTVSVGDKLRIVCRGERTVVTSGNTAITMAISPTIADSVANLIGPNKKYTGDLMTTTNRFVQCEHEIFVKSATVSETISTTSFFDNAQSTAKTTNNTDWTVTQYFTIMLNNAQTDTTSWIGGYSIELIKSS